MHTRKMKLHLDTRDPQVWVNDNVTVQLIVLLLYMCVLVTINIRIPKYKVELMLRQYCYTLKLENKHFIVISMPPHVFFLYIHIVELLICKYIYNEGS